MSWTNVAVAAVLAAGVIGAAPLTGSTSTPAVKVEEVSPKAKADLDAAAATLEKAIVEAKALPEDQRQAVLEKAAKAVAADLGAGWTATERLNAALAGAATRPATDAAWELGKVVDAVRRDLAFRPIVEAPVPPGWPAFTPVGEIEVKTYPGYRAAFTTKKPAFFRQNRNFWTLFQHISSRDIPMTAPVEMPMQVTEDGKLVETAMAFLYPDQQTGKTGETDDGAVEVIDVEPVTVVNLGVSGKTTASRMNAGHARLKAWLEANADRWEQAGPPRVMGWNSPSVPDGRSYMEVQIPIRERKK